MRYDWDVYMYHSGDFHSPEDNQNLDDPKEYPYVEYGYHHYSYNPPPRRRPPVPLYQHSDPNAVETPGTTEWLIKFGPYQRAKVTLDQWDTTYSVSGATFHDAMDAIFDPVNGKGFRDPRTGQRYAGRLERSRAKSRIV